MAYPDLCQAQGTILVPRPGGSVRNRVATNQVVRPRSIASATFYDPVVVHVGLTAAELATFMAFYAANRATSFSYTHMPDGSTRTCVFDASRPFTRREYITSPHVFRFDLTVNLLQAS